MLPRDRAPSSVAPMKVTCIALLTCLSILGCQSPSTGTASQAKKYTPPTEIEKIVFTSVLAEANEGKAQAQFQIGELYFLGKWVPENPEEAIAWYRKAAKQGHLREKAREGWIEKDW